MRAERRVSALALAVVPPTLVTMPHVPAAMPLLLGPIHLYVHKRLYENEKDCIARPRDAKNTVDVHGSVSLYEDL